jgi:hypothetical protein
MRNAYAANRGVHHAFLLRVLLWVEVWLRRARRVNDSSAGVLEMRLVVCECVSHPNGVLRASACEDKDGR